MNPVAKKLQVFTGHILRCFVGVLLLSCANANAQSFDTTLRLVFAGDLMGHVPLHTAVQQGKDVYNYAPCFQYVKDYVQSADLAVINLEVTLGGAPYTGYPCFSAPDAYAAAVKDAGFDIMTTANNHCMDKGRRGLERTIDVLDSLKMLHLGTYKDSRSRQDQHPLIVERNGIRLALICYTYGTNGINVRQPNVVNLIDTTVIRRDIVQARRQQADFIIALVHWGVEYQHHHNASQEALADWLLRNGCDAIVGSHPHVVQDIVTTAAEGADTYPHVVVYSLGNFLSNQRDKGSDGGIMVEMELRKTKGETRLHNAAYLPLWVNRTIVGSRRQYQLIPTADALEYPESYGLSDLSLQQLRRFHEHVASVVCSAPARQKGKRVPVVQPSIPPTRFYNNRQAPQPWLYTYQIIRINEDFPQCPDTSYCYVYNFNGQSYVSQERPSRNFWITPFRYFDLAGHRVYLPSPTCGLESCAMKAERLSRVNSRWHVCERTDTMIHYRFMETIDNETIDFYVHPSMQESNPVVESPRFPGIVDSVSLYGGEIRYRLVRSEILPRCHTPLPLVPPSGFDIFECLPVQNDN